MTINTDSVEHSELNRSPLKCVLSRDQVVAKEDHVSHENLVDFSEVQRIGVKGKAAKDWLTHQGLAVPAEINEGIELQQGGWVLRLGSSEYWILSDPSKEYKYAEVDGECYSVYCAYSRAWFVLKGADKASVMAKVCGVDLREDGFPLGSIAQTSVAKVNAVIVHHLFRGESVFSILSDSASARYLWDSFVDACDNVEG